MYKVLRIKGPFQGLLQVCRQLKTVSENNNKQTKMSSEVWLNKSRRFVKKLNFDDSINENQYHSMNEKINNTNEGLCITCDSKPIKRRLHDDSQIDNSFTQMQRNVNTTVLKRKDVNFARHPANTSPIIHLKTREPSPTIGMRRNSLDRTPVKVSVNHCSTDLSPVLFKTNKNSFTEASRSNYDMEDKVMSPVLLGRHSKCKKRSHSSIVPVQDTVLTHTKNTPTKHKSYTSDMSPVLMTRSARRRRGSCIDASIRVAVSSALGSQVIDSQSSLSQEEQPSPKMTPVSIDTETSDEIMVSTPNINKSSLSVLRTPEQSIDLMSEGVLDSAKKRKKTKRNSLSAQLELALRRQASERRLLNHEWEVMQRHCEGGKTLLVTSVGCEGGQIVMMCTSQENIKTAVIADKTIKGVTPGVYITLLPPWQNVDLKNGPDVTHILLSVNKIKVGSMNEFKPQEAADSKQELVPCEVPPMDDLYLGHCLFPFVQ